MLRVTTPSLVVECSGEMIQTPPIKNYRKNPNFPSSIFFITVVGPSVNSLSNVPSIKTTRSTAYFGFLRWHLMIKTFFSLVLNIILHTHAHLLSPKFANSMCWLRATSHPGGDHGEYNPVFTWNSDGVILRKTSWVLIFNSGKFTPAPTQGSTVCDQE